MSQTQEYNIACPECQCEQNVMLYDSINIAVSPELRQLLTSGQLNVVQCEQCDHVIKIEKPLLYTDPDNLFMIYWLPDTELAPEDRENLFSSLIQSLSSLDMPDEFAQPEMHLVIHWSEFVERIYLLEAGLDERIIEYIKHMIYSQNLGKIDPREKALLFDFEDSTEDDMCFVIQDIASRQLEGILQYGREAYQALCEMFDDDNATVNLLELFPGPYISARALLCEQVNNKSSLDPHANQ